MNKSAKASLIVLLFTYVGLTVWGALFPDADAYSLVVYLLLGGVPAFMLAVLAVNHKGYVFMAFVANALYCYLLPKAVFGTNELVWLAVVAGLLPLLGILVGLLFSGSENKAKVSYRIFTWFATVLFTAAMGTCQYVYALVVALSAALSDTPLYLTGLRVFGSVLAFFAGICLVRLATFLPYRRLLELKTIHYFIPILIVSGVDLVLHSILFALCI